MKKSIIVVGNGSSLRNSSLGTKIDEFDEVFRINHWKTTLFSEDVGSKTTNWIMYNPKVTMPQFINSYNELGLDDDQIAGTLKELKEIWYICWKPENLLENWKENHIIKELGIYHLPKRHLSVQISKKIRRITDPPNTGFILLYLLTQMYNFVYITGFDFGNLLTPDSKYHHYFGNKMASNNSSREIHDLGFMYEYIKSKMAIGEIRVLSKDSLIEKSNAKNISIDIYNCNKCGRISELYWWENKICNHCEGE